VGKCVELKANDGHQLSAYVAKPNSDSIVGLVVIQEAFGVNRHIRTVADEYAMDGSLTVAPAMFDRMNAESTWVTREGTGRKQLR
jgi:carboxymethylenebutenolidase